MKSKRVSHFMRNPPPTFQVISIHPNSKQVPSNFKTLHRPSRWYPSKFLPNKFQVISKHSTDLPGDIHPNSKQVPSNFKSQLKKWNYFYFFVLCFLVHVISILWTLFLSAFLIQIPDSIFYGIKIPKRAQQTWPQVFSKPPNSCFHSSFVIHQWIFVHSLCCL